MNSVKAVEEIVEQSATKYNVTAEMVMGEDRHRPIIFARHETWLRVHTELDWPYMMIGQYFGFDHTTIMNGVRKATERVKREQRSEADKRRASRRSKTARTGSRR